MNKIEINSAINAAARRVQKKYKYQSRKVRANQRAELAGRIIDKEHEPLKLLGVGRPRFVHEVARVCECFGGDYEQ